MEEHKSISSALDRSRSSQTDERDQLPLELINQVPNLLKLHTNKRLVEYVGRANHEFDVGSIRTSKPSSTTDMTYYFEVQVNGSRTSQMASRTSKICVTVGVSCMDFPLKCETGTIRGTFGYRGKDGTMICNGEAESAFGQPFTSFDVIGCGINRIKGELFFTRNGLYLGPVHSLGGEDYYPTISLHGAGNSVTVNFGDEPFLFNLRTFRKHQLKALHKRVINYPLSRRETVLPLIRAYLLHQGYQESLQLLEFNLSEQKSKETKSDRKSDTVSDVEKVLSSTESFDKKETNGDDLNLDQENKDIFREQKNIFNFQQARVKLEKTLQSRKHIRNLVMNGEIAESIEMAQKLVVTESLVSDQSNQIQDTYISAIEIDDIFSSSLGHLTLFRLRCLEFINFLKQSHFSEAIRFARTVLTEYRNNTKLTNELQVIMGLLCYHDPTTSPMAVLASASHAKFVADQLNATILHALGVCLHSGMELLLRQGLTVRSVLQDSYNIYSLPFR